MRHIFENAGISFIEAAQLLHISRSTFYVWADGGVAQNKYVFEEAEKTLQKIKIAVEARKLPLRGIAKKERMGVLKKILASCSES